MKKILVIILLILGHRDLLNAELIKSKIYDAMILNNGDTILTTRSPGDWWYGGFVTGNYSSFFGDFYFPEKLVNGMNVTGPVIKYKDGNGFPGYSLGIVAEYNPLASHHSYYIEISVFESFKNKITYGLNDELKREYIVETNYNYFSISPFYKYKFFTKHKNILEGLYSFCGINLQLPISSDTKYIKAFNNPERIEEKFSYKTKNQLTRIGGRIGIGWDIFDASVDKGARTIFSPFIAVNFGSKMLEDFDSDQISINFQLGMSLKIGIDRKKIDTLKYQPQSRKPLLIPDIEPSSLAENEDFMREFETQDLEVIYINPVEDESIRIDEPRIEPSLIIDAKPQKPSMAYNKKYIVNYPKSETDVEISKTNEGFFEELASFLIKNPESIIIIEGYNDDRGGSIRENQRLSILRAENAKQELVKRGISSGRIVSSGKGAIKNIASNETAAGRAKNRRIEIIIKQNKPPNVR